MRIVDVSQIPVQQDMYSPLHSHGAVREFVEAFGDRISHIEADYGSWATVEMECGGWLNIPKAAIKRVPNAGR